MQIAKLIVYVSIIAWILPVFRQYKGNFFYYFLIWALADPFNVWCAPLLKIHGYVSHSIAGLLLFYSVGVTLQSFIKNWVYHLLLILGFLSALYLLPNLIFLLLFIHFLILYKFIKLAVIRLHSTSELNIFYLVLIFYETSLLVKLIVLISGTETAVVLFYLTLLFQILVAIFFTIFREESSLITIRLKPLPE